MRRLAPDTRARRRRPWSVAVLVTCLSTGAAMAADDAEKAWQGSYQSKTLKREVTVRLTLPTEAKPGELRFVTMTCSVGLESSATANSFVIRPAKDLSLGPYCANWLGGSVVIQPGGDEQQLRVTVSDANAKWPIEFKLSPVGAGR